MSLERRSISQIALVAVLSSTLVVVLGWKVVSLAVEVRAERARVRKAVGLVAERLAHTLAGPLWNYDSEEVQKAVEFEARSPEVLAVVVRNDRGEVVAGLLAPEGASPRPIPPGEEGERFLATAAGQRKVPVTVYDRPVGEVTVYLDPTASAARLRADALAAAGEALGLSLMLAGLVYLILRRQVIQPILRLDRAVAGLDGGAVRPLPAEGAGEVRRLAATFEAMTRRLEQGLQEQRRLLRELRAQQEQFSSLAAGVPGVLERRSAADLSTVYLSENFEALSGLRRAEFVGPGAPRRLDELVHPEDLPALRQALATAGAMGRYDVEYRVRTGDGRQRRVHETGRLVRDEAGAPAWIDSVAIDVTEARAKDEQLRQVQKMETIGLLAGGLAHDLNNILAAVLGATSVLRYELEEHGGVGDADLREMVQTIELSGDRAKGLVGQLLTLARRQELQLTTMDLQVAVRHVVRLLERTIDKSIRIQLRLPEAPVRMAGDPVQVEQLVLNLCVNAAHAMTSMRPAGEPWGGTLTLSVRPFRPDVAFRATHAEAQDRDYAVLAVEDTGVGMSRETLALLYTPFFTTKPKGQGTGLGLPMTYSITRDHGGFLRAYSEPGQGTRFEVYLPADLQAAAPAPDPAPARPARGQGTILVVEDEAPLRGLAKRILEDCGYVVLEAGDGAEAVKLFGSLSDRIGLVLLDLVMPVMSGREAFQRIRQIDPRARVLLSSGFRLDARVQELLDAGVNGFVDKPYTMASLTRAVAACLEEARP